MILYPFINDVIEETGYSINSLKNKFGVYTITNKINGKIYVGSSSNLYSRLYNHIKFIYKKKHPNKKIHNSSLNHNFEDYLFEIIKIVDDRYTDEEKVKIALKHEVFLIDRFQAVKFGYNIKEETEYSTNGRFGKKLTLEQLENHGKIRIGQKAWNKGIKTGPNLKSSQTKKGVKTWNAGIKYSDELIIKSNKLQLKPVVQYDLNENKIAEFISMSQASKATKINLTVLRKTLNGINIPIKKTRKNSNVISSKYIWKYKELN